MNYSNNHYKLRDTNYNRNVCCNLESINNMVAVFDSAFDEIINFTEEISSIKAYPFELEYIPTLNADGTVAERSVLVTAFLGTTVLAPLSDFYYLNPDNAYLNFGQYFVEPYFNNFADYEGYTKIKALLPFVGFVDIDVNECMGKWLQFRLIVDYYTGKGLFVVGVTNRELTHGTNKFPDKTEDEIIRPIATFECSVGIDIPLGSSNAGDIARNLAMGTVKTAATLGFGMASLTAPPAVTSTTSTVAPTVKTYDVQGRSTAKGSRLKTIKSGTVTTEGGSKTTTTVHHKSPNVLKPISDVVNSSLDTLNSLHAGGSSDRPNDSGLMWDVETHVQIYIYRPRFVEQTEDYGALYGYPLGEVAQLNEFTGYTEINAIHIEGAGFETITNKEVALLEEVFANGIIL